MSKTISIQSFRGGTGKTTTTTNVAALLARTGLKVGVIDIDIHSPGLHVLFGLTGSTMGHTINDFLWGNISNIADAAHDVTSVVGDSVEGQLWLIPASINVSDIARTLREGYDHTKLGDSYDLIKSTLSLDVLIIDTHPGLSDDTLLAVAVSQMVGLILRPDQQDYQGTSVSMAIANKLDVPAMRLIVNKSPMLFNPDMVRSKVETAYDCKVAAVLPHADEMMALASEGLFVLKHPEHPLTEQFKQVARQLMS